MWGRVWQRLSRARVPPWPAIVSWFLAAVFAAAALVRVVGLDSGSLLVQLTAFTPYVALASILAVVVAGLSRRWWALGVASVTAIALVACVAPRAFAAGDPTDGAAMTVMSMNMRLGEADAESIVDLVREADVDVLALQEYTPRAEAALTRAGLADLLPYRESHPGAGPRGSALFSRLALTAGGVRPASAAGYNQAYATVSLGGAEQVVVESVHPVPPIDAEQTQRWTTGLRNQVPADAAGPRRILAGDFNATVDHSEFRRLLDTGYRDAACEVGEGLTPTWPFYGGRSVFTPRITLDHVLVPAGVGVREFRAVTIPRTDHRAIVVTLTV